MTIFITRMRGSDQTRPEGGAHATLGPARPAGQWTTVATPTIESFLTDPRE
jgi:hypothetical protein